MVDPGAEVRCRYSKRSRSIVAAQLMPAPNWPPALGVGDQLGASQARQPNWPPAWGVSAVAPYLRCGRGKHSSSLPTIVAVPRASKVMPSPAAQARHMQAAGQPRAGRPGGRPFMPEESRRDEQCSITPSRDACSAIRGQAGGSDGRVRREYELCGGWMPSPIAWPRLFRLAGPAAGRARCLLRREPPGMSCHLASGARTMPGSTTPSSAPALLRARRLYIVQDCDAAALVLSDASASALAASLDKLERPVVAFTLDQPQPGLPSLQEAAWLRSITQSCPTPWKAARCCTHPEPPAAPRASSRC